MDKITEQITRLQASTFEVRLGDIEVEVAWSELPLGAQDDLLGKAVDWSGLSQEDRSDVVMRVMEGHAPERWMDGVRMERIGGRFDGPDAAELEELAAQKIEWVKSMSFIVEDGQAPEPCSDCFMPWWENMNPGQQKAALMEHVDWTGIEGRREEMISAAVAQSDLERQADEHLAMREMEEMFRDIAEPPDFEMPDLPVPGRYEVWHTTDSMAGIAAMRFGQPIPEFPGDYTQVGIVEADGLDRAFELTNTTESAWIEKPGVVQARLEDMDSGTRSTSIGDVIVAPDGIPYRVGTTGFAEIERGGVEPSEPWPEPADLEATISDLEMGWGQARSDALLVQEHPQGWESDEGGAHSFDEWASMDQKALFAEWRIDYEAARLRDTGQDYETFLRDANPELADYERSLNQARRPANDNEKGMER